MNANLAALAYLVAGVLFILALRGLSSPETSRRGNLFGMIGMAIAVATTLAAHPPVGFAAWVLVVVGVALGGGAGAMIARRVPMTSMPELVAAFHSLVGLAAVLVAAAAFYAPAAFDIGAAGAIHGQSLIELSLGPGDRRGHLHRLGDRLRQALRPHERQADPSARPAPDQHRARPRPRRARRLVLRAASSSWRSGCSRRSRSCSACSSSSRSAAPTCRS